jgi:hypothetical protein
MMWIIFASVSAVVVALLVFYNYRTPTDTSIRPVDTDTHELQPSVATSTSPAPSREVLHHVYENEDRQHAYENISTSRPPGEELEDSPQGNSDDDPLGRMFGEL